MKLLDNPNKIEFYRKNVNAVVENELSKDKIFEKLYSDIINTLYSK